MWKMKQKHSFTWNVARKLKNVEDETQTLYDLEYGEKNCKTWKMRHKNCFTWIMARKLKSVQKEKLTL